MSVKLPFPIGVAGAHFPGHDPLKQAEQTLETVREDIERLDEMALHAKALVKSVSHGGGRLPAAVGSGLTPSQAKGPGGGAAGQVSFESLHETVEQVQVQAQLLGASMSLYELHGAHRDASSTLRWVGFYAEMLQELNQRLESTLQTMAAKGLLDD